MPRCFLGIKKKKNAERERGNCKKAWRRQENAGLWNWGIFFSRSSPLFPTRHFTIFIASNPTKHKSISRLQKYMAASMYDEKLGELENSRPWFLILFIFLKNAPMFFLSKNKCQNVLAGFFMMKQRHSRRLKKGFSSRIPSSRQTDCENRLRTHKHTHTHTSKKKLISLTRRNRSPRERETKRNSKPARNGMQ